MSPGCQAGGLLRPADWRVGKGFQQPHSQQQPCRRPPVPAGPRGTLGAACPRLCADSCRSRVRVPGLRSPAIHSPRWPYRSHRARGRLAAGEEGLLVGGSEVPWGGGHLAGALVAARPPAQTRCQLISMGEGRWRGGAAGRAGTSLACPAGQTETQSASDGGGARPFTRRGGPGAGGEEFPPPGEE